ncbi:hypothetical protein [Ornithinimicrobium cavernae]|uniref:hypothetical protein n=1 Tax=Ornithinimicrobium cavernae TaxID=2666047 RepID=UPI000D68F52C|nr:hypothetical protein [Ornithinimicrobium cavernae]
MIAAGLLLLSGLPCLVILAHLTVGLARMASHAGATEVHARETVNKLSSIAWATARSRDTASSVGKVAPDIRWMKERLKGVPTVREQEAAREAARLSPDRLGHTNPYAPGLIQVSKVAVPQMAVPGRAAASRPDDPLSDAKLATLLAGNFESSRPLACVIGSDALVALIRADADVTRLYPSYEAPRLPEGTAFLVIEDRALLTGPWAGALQTNGTALFGQLNRLAESCRAMQVVVVYVDGAVPPGHFTQSLKEMATVVIHPDRPLPETDLARMPALVRTLAHGTAQEGGA